MDNRMIQVQEGTISLPDAILKKMADVARMKAEVEAFEKQVKDEMLKAMEEHGVKSFENDIVKMTYVASTVRKGIDQTMLKAMFPEVAESVQTESVVKSSLRITWK